MVAMQDATDEIELEIQTLGFQHIFGQQIGHLGEMPPLDTHGKRSVSGYVGALPGRSSTWQECCATSKPAKDAHRSSPSPPPLQGFQRLSQHLGGFLLTHQVLARLVII